MLRQKLKEKGCVLVGGAWDVLSAKLFKKAGFDAVHMNSFCVAGINGVPDIGLITWLEYLEYTRRMVAIPSIPVVVDAEQGFGYKNVAAHIYGEFERVGMAAYHIDDKGAAARCPYLGKPDVVPLDEIVGKIEAVVKARRNPEVMIICRSAAAHRYGFDEMMKRLKAFKEAGADALWPSTWKLDDLSRVAEAFPDTPLCLSLTPYKQKEYKVLTVETAKKLGFSMIFFSTTIFFKALKEALAAAILLKKTGDARAIWPDEFWQDEFFELVELDEKWK
jgi:2-methylisocitrate lyase-like PEP mutase family enzyme